jgi:Holliday junction resolvase RusA-like endonuclease
VNQNVFLKERSTGMEEDDFNLKIEIPGLAAPKSVSITRYGSYNNKRVKEWMTYITTSVLPYSPRKAPKGVPVSISVLVWLPWPKKTPKKVMLKDPYAFHVKKPDADNLLKPIVDSLTNAGLWEDDNQISKMFVEKRNCPPGEERVVVFIKWEE